MVQPSPSRDDALVAAARGGDRAAWNDLARRHLPMVYNLVRRALHDDPDVDDVVQDIMVRAVRQLPDLRSTSSLRPWLAAIAVRQIGSHQAREKVLALRVEPLDAAADQPDPSAEIEGPALLRAELTTQRRLVGHAIRWLGAADRTVYSLWWLEAAGELTRPETAVALGTNVAHAGVRVQRMREQLEVSRRVVAALDAVPGCDALGEVIADWDGTPAPFWRKRIGRHIETCPICGPTAERLLPTERLLTGLLLLPVPAALLRGPAASWLSRVLRLAALHPVATTVSAGVLALGIAVPVAERPASAPAARAEALAPPRLSGTGAPQPRPSDPLLVPGRVSLESASIAGRYVAVAGDRGVLAPARDPAGRRQATLDAVAGLADPSCFSFRGPDGRYLRHSSFQLRLSSDEGTVLFRRDATFCAREGFLPGSLALESVNYPGFFLRHVGDQLWIDQFDGSAGFRSDGSFLVRPPLN
jgi:RNA polymerase sigma factor (sigma-70 family)